MKKFLIYLVSILIVVAIGFTVFFVVRDEERIFISANTLYVDVNDTFTIDVTFENKKSYTTVEISSEVPSVVSYNKETNTFTAVGGGLARIRFKTNNVKFRNLYCDVYVGDGSKTAPFYIQSAKKLASIGYEQVAVENADGSVDMVAKYPLDANYKLANNIDLSTYNGGYWQPIGSISVQNSNAFTGTFDGNGYTISGMRIDMQKMNEEMDTAQTAEEVGLFAKLGVNATVSNIKFSNVNIDGSYTYGGIVAGTSLGATIERIEAKNVYINNNNLNTPYNGGIVGYQNDQYDEEYAYTYVAKVDRCSITNLKMGKRLSPDGVTYEDGSLVGYIGGLVGYNQGGIVIFSYISDADIKASNGNVLAAGGLVGYNTHFDNNGKITNSNDWVGGHVKDSYASVNCEGVANSYGMLIGYYDLKTVVLDNTLTTQDGKTVEKTISKVYGLIYDNSKSYVMNDVTPNNIAIGNYPDQPVSLDAKYVAYGLTPDEMQNSANYISYKKEIGEETYTYKWPINDVWYFKGSSVNHGYPVLDYAAKVVSYGISDIGDANIISNVTDFKNMNPNKDYVLTADIVIDNTEEEWTGIDNFSGKFYVAKNNDGTYPTISFKKTSSAPIFNTITQEGEVHNLHVVNSTFENLVNEYFGIIAGENYGLIESAVITDCSITGAKIVGAVAGYNAGGITGKLATEEGQSDEYCMVSNTSVLIKAGNNTMMIGGIAGFNEGGSIRYVRVENSNVEVQAQVDNTTQQVTFGDTQAGGIVGNNYAGLVEDAIYFNPTISGVKVANAISNVMVGGIAGETSGRMMDSYVYANISGKNTYENVDSSLVKSYAGGLAGKVSGDPTKIDDTYATHIEDCGVIGGSVSGYYAGGLVGYMSIGNNPTRILTQDIFEYFKGSGYNAVTTNEAPIDLASSYTNASVSGYYVGGLVSYISNGRVQNCYANSSLKGASDGAQKAGLVALAKFSYIQQNSSCAGAVIEYCYSNCEFDTTGENYALATGNFRKSSFRDFINLGPGRQDGFFLKCLYNVDRVNAGEAKLPSSDDVANFVLGSWVININTQDWMSGLQNFWNKLWGTNVEFNPVLVGDYNNIVCREADMKGENPYAFIDKNGYNKVNWIYQNNQMPTLTNCDYYVVEQLEDGSRVLVKQ